VALSAAFVLALVVSPAHSQTRLDRAFEKWRVTCVERAETKNCAVSQSFSNQRRNVVFSWTIGMDDQVRKAIIRTPTNVLLAEGVRVSVGGGDPAQIPYRTCGPRFCFAEFTFSDEWLKAFQTGQTVPVSFTAANGDPVEITLDLKGFSAAHTFFQEQLGQAAAAE
jgi:invasion protein IalB